MVWEPSVVIVAHDVCEVEPGHDEGDVIRDVDCALTWGKGGSEEHAVGLQGHLHLIDQIVVAQIVHVGVSSLSGAGVLPVKVNALEAVFPGKGNHGGDEGRPLDIILGHQGVLTGSRIPATYYSRSIIADLNHCQSLKIIFMNSYRSTAWVRSWD